MTIYWTDADVSHLSQMSHLHFFSIFFAKKFGEGKMFDVSLHRFFEKRSN